MTLEEGPARLRPSHTRIVGHRRPVAAARLPRRVPELRRAGRVPLGGVAVRGLQLLPSTVVRAGDALRKIGESAELFDDYSPLQLGAAGKYQGAPFTLVGRLQYRYAEGTWNEWHALFESGAGRAEIGLAVGRQRPLRLRLRRAAADAAAAARAAAAGRAAHRQRPELDRRLGRRRQADRRPGRAAEAAEPRARLRRRRPALEPRRGRHPRLHRPGAAGLVGRPLGRARRPGADRPARRRARRRSPAAACTARTAARRSRSSWRRRSRSSARNASR